MLRADIVPAKDVAEFAQAVAEGLTLSEFNAGTYKTTEAAPAKPAAWTVVVGSAERVPATDKTHSRLQGRKIPSGAAQSGHER